MLQEWRSMGKSGCSCSMLGNKNNTEVETLEMFLRVLTYREAETSEMSLKASSLEQACFPW